MSDTHTPKVGEAWGDDISESRQARLRALADRQREWAAQSEATRGDSAFRGVQLTGADLFWLAAYALAGPNAGAYILETKQQDLQRPHQRVDLSTLLLQGADLGTARLQGANLESAQLQGVNLYEAQLQGAALTEAQLQGADLTRAQLQGADLTRAQLQGAKLWGARMDVATILAEAGLDANTRLTDVVWNDAPLTQTAWQQAPRLGDETVAWASKDVNSKPKGAATRRAEFATAVRANRILAVTLRSQGLNEDADRYAYRAQVLQRQVLRRQGMLGRAAGSWLLDLVAGYGYKPMRSVFTYVLVVAAFAAAYFVLGGTHGALSWNEALVVSMTAFHGRGFFGSAFQPGDPQAAVAAIEALIGLLIEITFIATFTQRFFAR